MKKRREPSQAEIWAMIIDVCLDGVLEPDHTDVEFDPVLKRVLDKAFIMRIALEVFCKHLDMPIEKALEFGHEAVQVIRQRRADYQRAQVTT